MPTRRFTDSEVVEMRRRFWQEDVTGSAIAAEVNMHPSHMHRILGGNLYKTLPGVPGRDDRIRRHLRAGVTIPIADAARLRLWKEL
jgi:hypothetical protein